MLKKNASSGVCTTECISKCGVREHSELRRSREGCSGQLDSIDGNIVIYRYSVEYTGLSVSESVLLCGQPRR